MIVPVPPALRRAGSACASLWRKVDGVTSLSLSGNNNVYLSPNQNGAVLLNSSAESVLDDFSTPRPLGANRNLAQALALAGLLVPSDQDCACVTDDDCGNSASSPLTSWLHLTDRRNLRCDYCYLPHVREDMSPETGRAAIDATFRSALANGFKQVKLKYAGGEPLLRFPLIVELHQYAQSLADQHGVALEGVVLSNGTLLTSAMVETLKSLGLRLMISSMDLLNITTCTVATRADAAPLRT